MGIVKLDQKKKKIKKESKIRSGKKKKKRLLHYFAMFSQFIIATVMVTLDIVGLDYTIWLFKVMHLSPLTIPPEHPDISFPKREVLVLFKKDKFIHFTPNK